MLQDRGPVLKDWASTSFANAGLGCGATESQLLPMSFRAEEPGAAESVAIYEGTRNEG